MTTIIVVKKDGYAAIAADTLTTYGNQKESAEYVVNSEKIIKYHENYLATTGWGTFQQALQDFLTKTKKKLSFDNVSDIFSSGLIIHQALKDKYFLNSDTDEDYDFESSHGIILIVNKFGVFSLTNYHYAQEFTKFYAYGSGRDYAIGAMRVVYDDETKSAEDIARIGVTVASEFDDGTDLPMNCYTIKLK
jgi:ATP-dependent HslUV protease, peptidase subunit HslV